MSKMNPLLKFSLNSSSACSKNKSNHRGNSNNGWLTTKKKGIDDDKIACDKEKAVMVRKSYTQKRRGIKKNSVKNRKKRREYNNISDIDDDSSNNLDGFIVDDEDEDGEYVTKSDNETIELLSSESEIESFLPKQPRSTKVKPLSLTKLHQFQMNQNVPRKKRKAVHRNKSVGKCKTSPYFSNDVSSDDNIPSPSYFSKKKIINDDTVTLKNSYKTSSRQISPSPFESDSSNGKVANKHRKLSVLNDTSDDEPVPKKKNIEEGVSSVDVDSVWLEEDVSENKMKSSKRLHKKIDTTKMEKEKYPNDSEIIRLDCGSKNEIEIDNESNNEIEIDSESNNEDGLDSESNNEDEQEEYISPEARSAYSALDIANQLSKEILLQMTRWTKNISTKSSETSIPMGMIVDGALTINKLGDLNDASEHDHKFISKDNLKMICPKHIELADYQVIGVNWLSLLHGMKCELSDKCTSVNGVLADAMGLGKTCQTIIFLSWLKYVNCGVTAGSNSKRFQIDVCNVDSDDSHVSDDDDSVGAIGQQKIANKGKEHRPHLIVAPSSVLSNWKIEFEKFAPHMNVVKYHGSLSERRSMQHELRKQLSKNTSSNESLDVILVSYAWFEKERSDDRSFLGKFQYDYLVVDEGHLLKNSKGTRYKNLNRLSTRHRLLLTGTPVQNSPQELLSLICFLMPFFSRKNYDIMCEDNEDGCDMIQYFVQNGKNEIEAYRKLKQLFAPFVLRRKKEDVLKILPPKVRKDEFVELDATARTLYDSLISDHIKKKKIAFKHLFTQLRKTCHHPLLVRSRYISPTEKNELARLFLQYGAFQGERLTLTKVKDELEKFNDFDIHLTAHELLERHPKANLQKYILGEDDLFGSAKFVRLRSLMPKLIADGHRILIFSIWTSCLDLLSCLMDVLNLSYLRMDGTTPVTERQSLIDKYNQQDIPVFLLSTKACGLGINLTAADICIIHDLDFNPFNDLQAEDRCHRIGQKKAVTVIKLISKSTVDEDIYHMQQRKTKMNAAIMENDANASRDWSKNAIENFKSKLTTK